MVRSAAPAAPVIVASAAPVIVAPPTPVIPVDELHTRRSGARVAGVLANSVLILKAVVKQAVVQTDPTPVLFVTA